MLLFFHCLKLNKSSNVIRENFSFNRNHFKHHLTNPKGSPQITEFWEPVEAIFEGMYGTMKQNLTAESQTSGSR